MNSKILLLSIICFISFKYSYSQEENIINFNIKKIYSLSNKNKNIILLKDSSKVIIPSNYLFITELKENVYLVSDKEQELQEQFRYHNLQLVDKNFNILTPKNKLDNYVVMLNIGGIKIATTSNYTNYIEICDPSSYNYNLIDYTGKKILPKDQNSPITILFDDYIISDSKDFIYQISQNKNIKIPTGWSYYNALVNRKYVQLRNNDGNKYALFDIEKNAIKLQTNGVTSEIKSGKDEILKDFMKVYLENGQYQTIDNNGNVLITGNFYPTSKTNNKVRFEEAKTSGFRSKYNYYDLDTKSFELPFFVFDKMETGNLMMYIKDEYYTIIKKSNNETLYTEENQVKEISINGNFLEITKLVNIDNKKSQIKDIYSNKTDKVLYTNISSVNKVEGARSYFVLSIKGSSNRFIIDADGDLIVEEQNMGYGKIYFNNGTFETRDKKGKTDKTFTRLK